MGQDDETYEPVPVVAANQLYIPFHASSYRVSNVRYDPMRQYHANYIPPPQQARYCHYFPPIPQSYYQQQPRVVLKQEEKSSNESMSNSSNSLYTATEDVFAPLRAETPVFPSLYPMNYSMDPMLFSSCSTATFMPEDTSYPNIYNAL